MNKKYTFLITGAAGFVGACLVRRLVENNENVAVILKLESDVWRLKSILSKVKIFYADLTDEKTIRGIVRKVRPDVIYHLAAHGGYSFQDNPEKILMTNILGTWNLLKSCENINYKVFVNTGSSSEYGFKKSAMKESDSLEPNSYYAVAKSAQSLLCQYIARSKNKPIVTFRLFSIYGYYEEPSRLIPTLIRSALSGKDFNMVSPKTARDFVFIEDVMDAYLQVECLSKCSGKIFNIGSGREYSMKKVVDHILKLTKAKVKVHWGKMPSRIWDTDKWVADTQKTKKLLKWQAKTSLRQGLQKTIDWYKKANHL